VTVSYNYDLPIFASATGLKRTLLANWGISGISIFQSGTPFSVTDSGAGTAYLGPGAASATLGAQLANGASISGGTTHGGVHQRIDGYLNIPNFVPAPAAYPGAGVTAFGDLGRNIYRGPFQQNWDFSLIKHFRLTERQDLRFTADFFNIWNHANFGNPALNDVETTLCSTPGVGGCSADGRLPQSQTPFGKITSTVGTPRLIQFSLRYAF